MNLQNIQIPSIYEEIVNVYEKYYRSFLLDMKRIGLTNLQIFIHDSMEQLERLAKAPNEKDSVRAAIGILTLHNFGYKDFSQLTQIFDRLLPVIDPEYVKFMCWATGRLVRHPTEEQASYALHLFKRALEWSKAKGRRARPLAAAYMFETIILNAGSSIVCYISQFQSVSWCLILHPSIVVINVTAKAIGLFARTLIKYGRSELDSFIDFYAKCCIKMLETFEILNPIRIYSPLVILEQLMIYSPDYFISLMPYLCDLFVKIIETQSMIVKRAAYFTMITLSRCDPKQFLESPQKYADYVYSQIPLLISEFPKQTANAVSILIQTIPSFIQPRITDLKVIVNSNLKFSKETECSVEYDSIFIVYHALLSQFGSAVLPIDETLLSSLITASITEQYAKFFAILCKVCLPVKMLNEYFQLLPNKKNYDRLETYNQNTDVNSDIESSTIHYQSFQINSSSFPREDAFLFENTQRTLLMTHSDSLQFNQISDSMKEETEQENFEFLHTFSSLLCDHICENLEFYSPISIHNSSISTHINASDLQKNSLIINTLHLISKLPPQVFGNHNILLTKILKFINCEEEIIRCNIPKALYSLSRCSDIISRREVNKKLLQFAMYDPSPLVRCKTLNVLKENSSVELADQENVKLFQFLANDDFSSVRISVYKILEKLAEISPLWVSSITRTALVDCFFVTRKVSSLKQKANVIETLPSLIQASKMIIKAYSPGFMEILLDFLLAHNSHHPSNNFIEENAYNTILNGLIQSFGLLASLDSEYISQSADVVVPMFCNILITQKNRQISLSILNALYSILTAPASNIAFRKMSPAILFACSKFLGLTKSRSARIAALKVIGGLGIVEIHQKEHLKSCEGPSNINEELSRQFFQPGRDTDFQPDPSLLVHQTTSFLYFNVTVAKELLAIFNEERQKNLYFDVVAALVQVLKDPKMIMLSYFDAFVTRLLTVMENSSDKHLKVYLPLYTLLISHSSNNMAPFLQRTLSFIKNRFNDDISIECLDLIIVLIKETRDGFAPCAADTICLLVVFLEESKTTKFEMCRRVVAAFALIGVYATDLLYLIIPQICEAIQCQQSLPCNRVEALIALDTIVKSVDCMTFLGPIVRACNFSLHFSDAKTITAAFNLVKTLLQSHGRQFLVYSQPIIDSILETALDPSQSSEVLNLVHEVSKDPSSNVFRPIPEKTHQENQTSKFVFSEDVIISRALKPSLAQDRHLEEWLRSFVLCVISNSPSEPIRACANLANQSSSLAMKLFNPAFYSCWIYIKPKGQQQIVDNFSHILKGSEMNDIVAQTFLSLLVFMHKTRCALMIPLETVLSLCYKYNGLALSLRIEEKLFLENPEQRATNLIDTYVKIQDWPSATAIWRKTLQQKEKNQIINISSNIQKNFSTHPKSIFSNTSSSESSSNGSSPIIISGSHNAIKSTSPGDTVINNPSSFSILNYDLRRQTKSADLSPSELNAQSISSPLLSKNKRGTRLERIIIPTNTQSELENNQDQDPQMLEKLHIWDTAAELYKENYDQNHDRESLFGYLRSLMNLEKWNDIINLSPEFEKLPIQYKQQIAYPFAEAALMLGKWSDLADKLCYAPTYSTRTVILSALLALHERDFEKIDKCLLQGFSIIASKPISIGNNNQYIHISTMLEAQQLVEIFEMKKYLLAKTEEEKKSFQDVWVERMKFAPRDFSLLMQVISNRAQIVPIHEDSLLQLFQLKEKDPFSSGLEERAYSVLFSDKLIAQNQSISNVAKICHIMAKWNSGNQDYALSELKYFIGTDSPKISEPGLLEKCHFLYASWLLEKDDSFESLLEAESHLKKIISSSIKNTIPNNESEPSREFMFDEYKAKYAKIMKSNPSKLNKFYLPTTISDEINSAKINVEPLRRWAEVNSLLASALLKKKENYRLSILSGNIKEDLNTELQNNIIKSIHNALNALTKCTNISPSFPDVVQLLHLFFEHAEEILSSNKNATIYIEQLSPKLLLQVSPQLLVQMSHPIPEIASFVRKIVLNLLHEHYHALIFSIIVLKSSTNKPRAAAAKGILTNFRSSNPEVYSEVDLIRKSLLRAAVTWHEIVLQRISDAFDHYQRRKYDKMIATLNSILNLVKNPKCEMHYHFLRQYERNLKVLQTILTNKHDSQINHLSNWCQRMEDLIGDSFKKFTAIQLSSISPELDSKTGFFLAVPGTYNPSKQLIRIEYFIGQFSVYMSKQQPKDVVIKGDDGKYYQYLLKGHEDLRLDERIMQFFRLINSLLKKETCFKGNLIQTVCVVPISICHGLVQWVPGTDTLRSVVEQSRNISSIDPMIEYNRVKEMTSSTYDYLQPIQKTQVLQKIFNEIPDTDITDFLWIKTNDPQTWLRQIETFSYTTAINSIVGYVIGLGDRHPSNILIDRNTGKVIHIDFGDCFEKATKRRFLPEIVPFRLTRMMVSAMGIAGVDGDFRTAFVNMSSLLRENRRILVMILTVFVHEPLIDPEALDEQEDGVEDAALERTFLSRVATGSVTDKGRAYMIAQSYTSSIEMKNRVNQKLTGTDFDTENPLSVEDQASKLIKSATDIYNLASMYSGWCPFW